MLYKITVIKKSKYEEDTQNYYFSRDAASPALPLINFNLENVFKDNKIFQKYLELHFKSGAELIQYDSNHKMYRINHLLDLSNNQ
ncbi:MAG TPA: hypothetical protein VN026_07265 [Bacteroidia bacterium]|nr:hypothetical protein [Bacteroidia bacterium]